ALASGQLGTHAGAASAPTIGISARIVAGAAAVVACACAANGSPAASARASRIRLRIDASPEDTKPEGCCNPEPAATVTAGPCGAATVALSLPAAHPDIPAMSQTHAGSCHCGRIAFTLRGEVGRAIDCNCSMCRRRGALLAFYPREALVLTSKEGDYGTYRFNKEHIAHHFCLTCGIAPF